MHLFKCLSFIIFLTFTHDSIAKEDQEARAHFKSIFPETVRKLNQSGIKVSAIHLVNIEAVANQGLNYQTGEFRLLLEGQRPLTVLFPVSIRGELTPDEVFHEEFTKKAMVELEMRLIVPASFGRPADAVKSLTTEIENASRKLNTIKAHLITIPGFYFKALLMDLEPRLRQTLKEVSGLRYGDITPFEMHELVFDKEVITLEMLKDMLKKLEATLVIAELEETKGKQTIDLSAPGRPFHQAIRNSYLNAVGNACKVREAIALIQQNLLILEHSSSPEEVAKKIEIELLEEHARKLDMAKRQLKSLGDQLQVKGKPMVSASLKDFKSHRANVLSLFKLLEHFRAQGVHLIAKSRVMAHGAELHALDEALNRAQKAQSPTLIDEVVKRSGEIGIDMVRNMSIIELEIAAIKARDADKTGTKFTTGAVGAQITVAALQQELSVLREQFEVFEEMKKEAMEARAKFGKK